MSDDPDFDMEVVGDDELDDMGTDGASSPKEDFRPEASREESGTGTDETDDAESISSHSGSVATDSDREVFGLDSVPEEWNISSLPSVVEIEMGSSPPSSTYNEQEEGLPFYQGNADFGHMTPKVSTWCSDPVKTAGEDDVLISIRAPVGDLNIADEHCCIGRGLAALRPDKMNGLYLFYGLAQRSRWLSRLASGSTFKSVSSADLEKVDLPVPSLPEQRKIASVLYAVDQAIQKTEAIIEQAKRVKRGLMQDLLTGDVRVGEGEVEVAEDISRYSSEEVDNGAGNGEWEMVRLGNEEFFRRYGGDTPAVSNDEFWEGDILWLSNSEVTEGEVNLVSNTERLITREGLDNCTAQIVPYGSVILSCTASIGKVAVNRKAMATNQQFNSFKPVRGFNAYYLANQLLFRKQVLETMGGSTTHNHLPVYILEKFRVPRPSLSEQERIATLLYTADANIGKARSQIDQLKRLKKGLMQDLLTGEVRTMDKAIEVLGEVNAHG